MSYLHRISISNVFAEFMTRSHTAIAVVLLLVVLFIVTGCSKPEKTVIIKKKMPELTIAEKSKDPTKRTAVAVSSDSKMITVGVMSSIGIKLWDFDKSQLIRNVSSQIPPRFVGFTKDGIPFYACDETVVFWDKETGEPFHTKPAYVNKNGRGFVYDHIMLLPDESKKMLVAGDKPKYSINRTDDSFTVFNAQSKTKIRSFKINVNDSPLCNFTSSAYLSSDGKYICILEISEGAPINTGGGATTADSYSIINIYDMKVATPNGKIKLNGIVGKVVFAQNNQTLVILDEGQAYLYSPKKLELIRTLDNKNDPLMDIAYSPSNKYMVTGDGTRRIKIWDAMTGEYIKTLEEPRRH